MNRRIYFDHAATRFPKPTVMLDAMYDYSRTDEAASGRGAYRSSRLASEWMGELRTEIASWIDAGDAAEVSIHSGGTEALNTAIMGFLRPGDHVITSDAEHNSVLRPLHELARSGRITWTRLPANRQGLVDPNTVLDAICDATRMVAIVHANNVNGAVQDVRGIGSRLADAFRDHKPAFLVDAAQSFGYLPISVESASIDFLASPGHKGGSGPLGTGFLYVRESMQAKLRPLLYGGTGNRSESMEMANDYPSAFEAGNQNVPAACGWVTGLKHRRGEHSPSAWLSLNEGTLARIAGQLYAMLRSIPGLQLIGAPDSPKLPIASIVIDGLECDEAAMILDSEFGIEVRSGKHCAAKIHEHLGSPPSGTIRISGCEATTPEEIRLLEEALRELTVS
ncbi:MAG: aminotransferase class V-fold PLP-dependent enzyme [Planctomycetota bacterium]